MKKKRVGFLTFSGWRKTDGNAERQIFGGARRSFQQSRNEKKNKNAVEMIFQVCTVKGGPIMTQTIFIDIQFN